MQEAAEEQKITSKECAKQICTSSKEDVFNILDTSEIGLSVSEAKRRLEEFGPNTIVELGEKNLR